jgi:hypothetical protein
MEGSRRRMPAPEKMLCDFVRQLHIEVRAEIAKTRIAGYAKADSVVTVQRRGRIVGQRGPSLFFFSVI